MCFLYFLFLGCIQYNIHLKDWGVNESLLFRDKNAKRLARQFEIAGTLHGTFCGLPPSSFIVKKSLKILKG